MVVVAMLTMAIVMIVLPQRLQTGAQIAAKHLTPGKELVDRTVDRGAGYRKYAPARSEHRHADDVFFHVHYGPSFGPWTKLQVETHEAIDLPSATAVPNPVGISDNAELSEGRPFVIADGEHKMTGARYCIDGCRRGEPVRLEAKHCDIGRRITPGERRLGDASAWKRERDRLVTIHAFFSGNDNAGAPVDAAR
jgi:hypothetical protein